MISLSLLESKLQLTPYAIVYIIRIAALEVFVREYFEEKTGFVLPLGSLYISNEEGEYIGICLSNMGSDEIVKYIDSFTQNWFVEVLEAIFDREIFYMGIVNVDDEDQIRIDVSGERQERT